MLASPGYTYTYDFEGKLASKTETATGTVTTYAYDHKNRLTGVTQRASAGGAIIAQATYTYDAHNRRIRTQIDADGAGPTAPVRRWTVYDGENPYADFANNGSLQTRYLHGPAVDFLLARTAANGTTAWYLTDRLGSVRDIANTSGTVIDHIAYDAYGNITSESSPSNGDRFKFTGREYDPVTGLQYNRARYYDAAIGRWTQEDPIGFAAGDANLYRYVGNGPTNFTDASGLFADDWGQAILGGLQWTWDVGSAGAMGLAQGGANIVNGAQDVGVGVVNIAPWVYNNTAGRLGAPKSGYLPSPDWSKNLIVHEDETCHALSKGIGGTSATILLSAPAATRNVVSRAAGFARGTKAEVISHIDPSKFRYFFGEVTSGGHNTARSIQNMAQMNRIGIQNTAEGHAYLAQHLRNVVQNSSNVVKTVQKTLPDRRVVTLEVRESVLAGPAGCLKLQSWWEILADGSRRLSSLIPIGR